MKEKIVVTIAVSVLAAVLAAVLGGTDGIYIIASLLFFGLCVAYAEWCERLYGEIILGTLIVGLIALGLLIYLFVAMIWPENF